MEYRASDILSVIENRTLTRVVFTMDYVTFHFTNAWMLCVGLPTLKIGNDIYLPSLDANQNILWTLPSIQIGTEYTAKLDIYRHMLWKQLGKTVTKTDIIAEDYLEIVLDGDTTIAMDLKVDQEYSLVETVIFDYHDEAGQRHWVVW